MLKSQTLSLAIAAFFGWMAIAIAQYPGVQGTVERQIQLLEQKKEFAAGQIDKADAAMADLDFESAYAHFKSAVDILPQGGAATADVRSQALGGFCKAAVKLARQRISEGRYADGKTIVEVVLEESYDPNYGPALALRSQLLNPEGFVDRGTLTPGHVAKVEEVKKLLKEGEGYFATGRYDLAFKRCEQALNVDKWNIAARKLMERINGARQKYADAAYNETRGDLLMQVQKAWELPVRKFTDGPTSIIEQPDIAVRASESISEKLDEIIIPKIDFTDSSIVEAIGFLRKRAAELDNTESDPKLKGVNIVLKLPPDSPDASYPITLSLQNVPLRAALDYVSRAANLKTKIERHAVVIVPQSENTDVMITKEYKVPPGFIQSVPGSAPETGADGQPVAASSKAKNFLESQGVAFPPGASANYIPSSSRLIVKNSQPNLDFVDSLVEIAAATKPTQVEIEAKFLEVTQNNLNELGFDWLLGQFALAGGSGVYGGGGTMGFGRSLDNGDYPMINPGSGVPVGASSAFSGPITAGNRGGAGGSGFDTAIQLNAVDALLLGAPVGAAPGILSVAGVFTNPQFQVVLRALSQKKGIDLVSAPKVTSKSGARALIEIIRDFRYPTEFEPPQVSGTNGSQYTPVVPNTPAGWETKHTGITLEVEPTIGPDNYTIELVLAPRVIEFEGFINYGSPINATVQYVDPLAIIPRPSGTFEATPNTMNQPVFSTREVTTQVSIYDGQTVALGGLMREDVQKVQDKVPILGDIPLAGRLFRSNVDQHIKRNLVMFVTAGLMDPAGQPLIKAEEDDAIVPLPDVAEMLDEAIPGDILSEPLPQ
ncbi:MAG: Amuc_1098 family type IV pilus outer membrane protein [Terrimicrobiaceae bacterium]